MRFWYVEEFINGSWQPEERVYKHKSKEEAQEQAKDHAANDKICGRKKSKRRVVQVEILTVEVLL